jgi:hypothetical protein
MSKRRGRRRDHFEEVRDGHLRRLNRLVENRAVAPIKKLYGQASDELVAKLAKHGSSNEKFAAHQHRILLAQVHQGQTLIAKKLTGGMADAGKEIQDDSLHGLIDDITSLEKYYAGADIELPIEESGIFRGIVSGRRESLLRAYDDSFANYGGRVVTKIEDALSLSLATGDTYGETIERVGDVMDGESWQVERIVRTEGMFSAAVTRLDGMSEAAREFDDLMMQWVEYVGEDGEPLDDRVAVDSLAINGQLAPPGGVFTMPARSLVPDHKGNYDVPDALIGQSWASPPNRPNDRATVVPWRPSWGVAGWVWKNGERVPWPE